jgi:DNA helicase HerA-like ATPase
VLTHLTSDEGKAELKNIGGLSASTIGVILRTLINFADQGAEAFFGEPEFDTADLLRVTGDGRGVVSLLELPNLMDRPAVFSTFLMWLLADLFHELPEVGDIDKPKLVFFFDEAHLLFDDATKAFLDAIAQTVRLIRSKGVGIFFVTQTPKDVPDDVLAQLGSRVQHQLRAHTPNEAKALKQTVATFPKFHYDLAETLQQLGIGEAIVTRDGSGRSADASGMDSDASARVADGADAGRGATPGDRGVGVDGEIWAVARSRLRVREARTRIAGGCRGGGSRAAAEGGRGSRCG